MKFEHWNFHLCCLSAVFNGLFSIFGWMKEAIDSSALISSSYTWVYSVIEFCNLLRCQIHQPLHTERCTSSPFRFNTKKDILIFQRCGSAWYQTQTKACRSASSHTKDRLNETSDWTLQNHQNCWTSLNQSEPIKRSSVFWCFF